MCFSAEASFAGGIILSAIGTATLSKVTKPRQKLFAGIPILFAAQQFAEGVLWITLKSGENEQLQNITTYIFLITALVIWPIMIPLSMWFMEESKRRRKFLAGLIITGGILSLFYASCLFSYDVRPQIQSFHIQYVDKFPVIPVRIALVFYLVSAIAPLYISSVKRMWLFGLLITVSYTISGIFFAQYLTSVWCFFAALISIVIFWVLIGPRTRTRQITAQSQP